MTVAAVEMARRPSAWANFSNREIEAALSADDAPSPEEIALQLEDDHRDSHVVDIVLHAASNDPGSYPVLAKVAQLFRDA